MSDPVKISVILPVYNAEKFLDFAVDSVLGQTLPEIELIAVDDHSSDGSLALLTRRAEKDSRLRVIAQESNRGTLSARKRGLSEARGTYIMFLDPDDYFDSDAAEKLYALAEKEQLDIIHFGTKEFTRLPDGTRKSLYNWTRPIPGKLTGSDAILRNLLADRGHGWSLCFKLIRRDLCLQAWRETGDFFCIMGEDMYFYLAVANHAANLLRIKDTFYHYNTMVGITSFQRYSLPQFLRTASLLDALNAAEKYLAEQRKLEDPALAAGWRKVQCDQYLILWYRWYALDSADRTKALDFLLEKVTNKENLILSIFAANHEFRENEEFLGFARRVFRVLNFLFPKNSYLRMKIKSVVKKFSARGKGN